MNTTKEKIIDLFNKGKSIDEICNELCYQESYVKQNLRDGGISTKSPPKIPTDKYQEVVDLYNQGFTVHEIAEKFNCCDSVIKICLNKMGVARRKKHNKISNEDINEMVELFKNGATVKDLMVKYNYSSHAAVVRHLQSRGVDINLDKKPKELTEKEKNIIQLYNSGKGAPEISKELSVGETSIYRILSKVNIKPKDLIKSGERQGCRKFSNDIELEIVEKYKNGMTMESLSKEYGCSGATAVRKILKRHNTETRKTGNKFREMTHEERDLLTNQWKDAESKQKLCDILGVSRGTINCWLKQIGITDHTKPRLRGENHGMWKGGRRVENGYVFVLIYPEDPMWCMANNAGYVAEHRLVMARHLGRPLNKNEQVHHKNGLRDDNRLENLQHRIGSHGSGQCLRCRSCGSFDVEPVEI